MINEAAMLAHNARTRATCNRRIIGQRTFIETYTNESVIPVHEKTQRVKSLLNASK